MNRNEVRWAQHLLNHFGFPAGTPDGVVGPKTEAAVRSFQWAWNGGRKGPTEEGWFAPLLNADAVLGPKTYACLTSLTREGMAPYLSPHFTVNELRSKGDGTCFVKRELLACLENIREIVGPFSPISAYRDPAYNSRLPGAAPNSQHIYGKAADISRHLGLSISQAERCGADGIGYHRWTRKVMHVDVRGTRARWTY